MHCTIRLLAKSAFRRTVFCQTRLLTRLGSIWNAGNKTARVLGNCIMLHLKYGWHLIANLMLVSAADKGPDRVNMLWLSIWQRSVRILIESLHCIIICIVTQCLWHGLLDLKKFFFLYLSCRKRLGYLPEWHRHDWLFRNTRTVLWLCRCRDSIS